MNNASTRWERYLWQPLGFMELSADEFKTRTTAVQLVLFTLLAAVPYSMLYAWLGFPLAPIATFVYVAFSVLNLLVLLLTKNYSRFTTAQLVFIILNPMMAHVAIGGFVDSSAIVLSAILSPLGALMFTNHRTARVYFLLFIGAVVFAGAWDYFYLDSEPRLPKGVRVISFVSNLVLICLIIYLLIENVLAKKEAAQQGLQQSIQELRATQNQLIQREKMASLGELTAGVAHEIQNPLNFVNNFSDVTMEILGELREEQGRATRDPALEAELLDDIARSLQKIHHHGQRAASIVKGMLEHSRASTGERQPTDLNGLCDEYLRLAYHGLRAKDKSFNATLTTDFGAGLPLVTAAGAEVGRVLLNLFTNAFYAVRQRQQLGEPGYQPQVGVRTVLLNQQVQIQVTDNGAGIPADVIDKIFQPFFTTKPPGEGTGLGLSLSYDIITQGHGGALVVKSNKGEGTEFTISLPA